MSGDYVQRTYTVEEFMTQADKAIAEGVSAERERCALICDILSNFDTIERPDLLRTAARFIRERYDPRPEIDPAARITIHPAPVTSAEQLAALNAAHGLTDWRPCPRCYDPMDCGSWQSCIRPAR